MPFASSFLNETSNFNNNRSIDLTKNASLDLTKVEPDLNWVALGGSWDPAVIGETADLDLSAFLLGDNGKVLRIPEDIIYFKNMQARGISLDGDNRTGEGDGDDETIQINLTEIEPRVKSIIFIITIFNAKEKNQTFGMIKNAQVRLINKEDNDRELLKYDLSENYSTETGVVACSLTRNSINGWTFKALGEGFVGDLNTLLGKYA